MGKGFHLNMVFLFNLSLYATNVPHLLVLNTYPSFVCTVLLTAFIPIISEKQVFQFIICLGSKITSHWPIDG